MRETIAKKAVRDNSSSTNIEAYERRLANSVGAKHAISFSYARIALRSILSAMGLGKGDEVVISPLNCKVIPLALLSLDLRPIYADISERTLNLDPQRVKAAIGPATRAILFQHTYGSSAGIETVAKIAAQKNVPLLEDCAQCLPYATDDYRPGSWGQAAIFSNNLRKPLPAGSGGVAVTNDGDLAEKVREVRYHLPRRRKFAEILLRSEVWVHNHVLRPALYWPLFELNRKVRFFYKRRSPDLEIGEEIGGKAFQISNYQIREGLRWLDRLEANVIHRRNRYADYSEALNDVAGLKIPTADTKQPLFYFPVLVERKDVLLKNARKQRIELIAWPLRTPIYPIENGADLLAYGYRTGNCPVAENVARRLVGLPTDHLTQIRQRDAVVKLLRDHDRSIING